MLGYLRQDWKDQDGLVHPEGSAYDFPYDTPEQKYNYEYLVHAEIISRTPVGPDVPPPVDPPPPSTDDDDEALTWTQATPSSTWDIAHPLGRRVNVAVFDTNNDEVFADITQPNVSRVVINFAQPMAGYATLS